MKSITVKLAGNSYEIKELTVGQLQDLHIGILEPAAENPKESARLYWERNVDIVAAALAVDHPEVTRDAILRMRVGSIQSVKKIVDEILKFSGLIQDEEQRPGEASAGAE